MFILRANHNSENNYVPYFCLPPPPMEEMITWYFVFEFLKNIIKSIAPVGRNLNRIWLVLIKMSSQKLVSSPPQAIFFDISDLHDNFLFDF